MDLRQKTLRKVSEEAKNNPYCVLHMKYGYIYVFHWNGAYDKVHEDTYGLLTCQSLIENIKTNSLFERAEKIRVCSKQDSWTFFKD